MVATKTTQQVRPDTSGDEDSVRITASAILERELKPPFLNGQLSRRLAPVFRVSVKYTGAKQTAFQAGMDQPHANFGIDRIWSSSDRHGDDREWPSVDADDALLDWAGSAKPWHDERFAGDVLAEKLLTWRHEIDSAEPHRPPDDDEPDDREWAEAA